MAILSIQMATMEPRHQGGQMESLVMAGTRFQGPMDAGGRVEMRIAVEIAMAERGVMVPVRGVEEKEAMVLAVAKVVMVVLGVMPAEREGTVETAVLQGLEVMVVRVELVQIMEGPVEMVGLGTVGLQVVMAEREEALQVAKLVVQVAVVAELLVVEMVDQAEVGVVQPALGDQVVRVVQVEAHLELHKDVVAQEDQAAMGA